MPLGVGHYQPAVEFFIFYEKGWFYAKLYYLSGYSCLRINVIKIGSFASIIA